MEKREKILKRVKLCAHAVPAALFALMLISLLIGSFALNGSWDKVSAAFLYPYMPLSIIGGAVGGALDIRSIAKKERVLGNILLLVLSVIHILLGAFLFSLHGAFSA